MTLTTDDLDTSARNGEFAESAPGPIQFSVRQLMIAITVLAVLLGLLTQYGILGAVAAVLATATFTWVIYPMVKRGDRHAQERMFDFLWGLGIPLICLIVDPGVFTRNPEHDDSWRAVCTYIYAFIGWETSLFALWLMIGRRAGWWAGLFAGTLVLGAVFAALLGFILFFPSMILVPAYGVGLLGLTPWMTALAHLRQFREANKRAAAGTGQLAVAAGLVIGILAPAMIGSMLLVQLPR